MMLLGIFMLYGFVRIFYYVIWDLKEDNLIWRTSWGLLSVINLLGGLYFLGYEEYLKKLKYTHIEIYYIYMALVVATFIYGGYKKNLMIKDNEKRRKMNYKLYSFIIALIIAIILNFNQFIQLKVFKAIVMVTGMRIRNILVDQSKVFNIKGSNVEGKDVTLDAKENLNVTASETTNKLEQDSKSSSACVGVGFDLATGQVSSVTISDSKSKGEVDANSTSYNESTIKADKNLDFTSGKDTNIKGGKLSGEKVTGNVGGDLNIESKQDQNSYEEKNSSAGFGIGINLKGCIVKRNNRDDIKRSRKRIYHVQGRKDCRKSWHT